MQTALVTGATRGIGRELAQRLAAEGMHVLLGARDSEHGRAAAASMTGEVEPVELDVASRKSIAALAQSLAGSIDLLVNNAGVYRRVRPRGAAAGSLGPGS